MRESSPRTTVSIYQPQQQQGRVPVRGGAPCSLCKLWVMKLNVKLSRFDSRTAHYHATGEILDRFKTASISQSVSMKFIYLLHIRGRLSWGLHEYKAVFSGKCFTFFFLHLSPRLQVAGKTHIGLRGRVRNYSKKMTEVLNQDLCHRWWSQHMLINGF